ncbi:hypothetical protein [Bacteroides thetaiotaomicron]|uniref:hypothetical protein n=1 Tax=Bacteroides thetaiotaomicron TaxID=818 RepID=UPI004063E712
MKALNFLAAAILITLCTKGYCSNEYLYNATTYKDATFAFQKEIKIVSTFTVTAKVARIVGIFPNQYLKYTNQTTLTIAIYSNDATSVIAVGDKQLGIPLPIRIAVLQEDYTFECSDKKNDVIYCFNTPKLQ